MVSFRSLEVFYWTAHLRSFSRAADRLNTTQPTISQRLRAMEELIGEPLLNRAAKPIALTSAGRTLFRHAELLLRQVAAMERDLDLSRHMEGTIRLGVSETIVQTWLATFLEQVARHFPKLDIDMTVDVTPSMMNALRDGDIDIALMLGPTILDGFTCIELKDYPLKFYAVPGLVPGNAISLRSMPSIPIITYPRNTYPYIYLRETLFRQTGRNPRIFTNSSISTIERMALDGLGVALVAEGTLSGESMKKLKTVDSDIDLKPLSFYAYFQAGVQHGTFEQLAEIAAQVAAGAP
ncbi:LysR family transcriptional regulator [Pararhizobium sp. LjRoot255]|jgi:DNA-binding transcriptional LysR family regulator|uniref:LysR family transcriptional regulator n=1 Tax=Pararhizobium sp. LjRoot255 TaxID=3342298 RepID=UPI003ED04E6B